MTNKRKMTVSVGLPTYEAGNSLVVTLRSIYGQTSINQISKILLVVDGNNINPAIYEAIKHPKLKVVFKTKRFGQSTRVNDIFKLATSDLLVLTNDDVILEHDAIEEIMKLYSVSRPDLIGIKVVPLSSTGLIENIINAGSLLSRYITLGWNKSDNYLACNGRFIALSHKYYKSVKLPKKLWNNDAFLYIYAKISGFSFKYLTTTEAYYKLPHTLRDHFSQSIKFSLSEKENQKYFDRQIHSFYVIPPQLQLRGMGVSLIRNPFYMSLYFLILLLARVQKFKYADFDPVVGYWKTDSSTKVLTGAYGK